MDEQKRSMQINAKPATCFQIIADFEKYPAWQKRVKEVTILEQEHGRAVIVEYALDATLKTINYTLRYSYDEKDPKKLLLSWDYVGGDLKKIVGSYIFEEVAEGKTNVTFYLQIEIGQWVPNFVMHAFREGSMQETLEALKKRAESLK